MDRGAWRGASPGGHEELDTSEQLSTLPLWKTVGSWRRQQSCGNKARRGLRSFSKSPGSLQQELATFSMFKVLLPRSPG